MIARSETIRASNAAAKETYRQSGVVKKIVWLANLDDRCCPWCEDLDGKVIDIEDNFFDKGDSYTIENDEGKKQTMDLDYSDVGYPPLHSACYDKDTEIYTSDGWKYFKDLTGKEKCFSFNPDNETENGFLPILHRIAYRHKGVMLNFKKVFSPTVPWKIEADLSVTPDHTMLIRERNKIVFKEALTLNPKLYKAILYDDMVYSVELSEWHTLWVRRNGKEAWCGNCRCSVGAMIED